MTLYAYRCSRCEATFEFEVAKPPKSAPCPSCGSAKTTRAKATGGTTGTYRYSEVLGTVVRVSARVPGLSRNALASEGPGPSCPPGGCGSCELSG